MAENKNIKLNIQLLKNKNQELQRTIDLHNKLATLEGKSLKTHEKIAQYREGYRSLLKEQSDHLAMSKKDRAAEIKDLREKVKYERELLAVGKEIQADGGEITEQERINLEIAEETVSQLALKLDQLTAVQKLTDDEREALKEINTIEESRAGKRSEAEESLKNQLSTFTAFLGIGIKFNETVIGGMVTGFGNAFKILGDGTVTMGTRVKALGGMIGDAFSPAKLAGMVATMTEKLFTGMDKAQAGFFKATQANDEFGDSVMDVQAAMVAQGLGFDDVGDSMKALYNNLTAFKNASEATRKELGVFVSTLNHLGIEASTTTQVMQVMNKSLGMTIDQTKIATEELVHFAKSINMSAETVMSEFGPAMQQLAAHGDKAIEVFKGLQKQSRATGISVTSLMNVAKQFDTFDSAAQSVGRLNGILGGAYLNSIEMVYATEEERMEMMRESLTLAGKSFDSLERYEKMTLAQAGGFASVAEAAAFYNTNLDDPAVQERIAQEEELAEMAKKTDDIMTRISQTMMQFAINMAPVIDGIRAIVYGFGEMMSWGNGAVGIILLLSIAIFRIVKAVRAWKLVTLQLAAAKGIETAAVETSTVAKTADAAATGTQMSLDLAGAATDVTKAGTETIQAAAESVPPVPFGILSLPGFIAMGLAALAGGLAVYGFANGTPPGGAPGGPALVNEGSGPEGIISGGMAGIIPGGPKFMNLKKGDHIIPNKNLGGPSAKDIGKEVASAVQGALSVNVDIASPDGKKIFDVVKKEENRNFRRTMQNRSG